MPDTTPFPPFISSCPQHPLNYTPAASSLAFPPSPSPTAWLYENGAIVLHLFSPCRSAELISEGLLREKCSRPEEV